MNSTLRQIRKIGIIPVVSIDNADDAIPLAQALIDGGLPCAEITFRTAAAKESLARIAKNTPSLLLGAGTVLSVEQAKMAIDAGARFIVSPGLSKNVVEYCLKNTITVMPGVLTPTEIGLAIDLGLNVVKFFPAEPSGGVQYLKALAAPFTEMQFVPTGGIDKDLLRSYCSLPYVVACGGSWMVKSELIREHRFSEITELSRAAVAVINGPDGSN